MIKKQTEVDDPFWDEALEEFKAEHKTTTEEEGTEQEIQSNCKTLSRLKHCLGPLPHWNPPPGHHIVGKNPPPVNLILQNCVFSTKGDGSTARPAPGKLRCQLCSESAQLQQTWATKQGKRYLVKHLRMLQNTNASEENIYEKALLRFASKDRDLVRLRVGNATAHRSCAKPNCHVGVKYSPGRASVPAVKIDKEKLQKRAKKTAHSVDANRKQKNTFNKKKGDCNSSSSSSSGGISDDFSDSD